MIETLTLADLCRSRTPLAFSPETPLSEALAVMRGQRTSAVVIVVDDRPVGIFTERDALALIVREAYDPDAPLGRLMTPNPITVPPELSFAEGYARMAAEGIRHLVVVDAVDRLRGVLSETDFAQALGTEELLIPRAVGDLMTRDPVSLPPQATLAEALRLMNERRISSVLVVAAGRVLGIITERDAVRLAGATLDLGLTPVRSQMSQPVYCIHPDAPAHEAGPLMRALGVRRLAVTDDSGRLVGILTRRDLLKDLQATHLRLLRQLVADQGRALNDARRQLSDQSVLRSLLEHSADLGIVAADAQRVVRFANQAALRALGRESLATECQDLREFLLATGLTIPDWAERLAALETGVGLALDLYHAVGEGSRWLRLTASLIRDAGGACDGYLLTLRDRTQEHTAAERLRAISANAPSGIGLYDLQGHLRLANPAFLDLLGYADHPQELLGSHFVAIIAPEDQERARTNFRRLLAGEIPSYQVERSYRRRDGRLIRADVAVSAIHDAAGHLTEALAIVNDISDLSRAQERLLEAQALAHLGSWEYDTVEDRLLWSDEAYRIFGQPLGTPLDLGDFLAMVHPEDREAVSAAYQQSLTVVAPYQIEHRIRRADGSERWVRERAVHLTDDSGRVTRSLGTVHDITEEHAAQAQQRLISALFDNTSEGILITDAHNRILAVNPAFTTLTGYPVAEVLGRDPSLLNSGRHDAAFFRDLWRQLEATGAWSGEIWNRRKNGEIFPAWLQINRVLDTEGRVTQHVAVFSDLSAAQRSAAEIAYLSHFDPLTGLPNGAHLRELLLAALGEPAAGAPIGAVSLADALPAASPAHFAPAAAPGPEPRDAPDETGAGAGADVAGGAQAPAPDLALLVLDLDRFQDLVASHGYLVGDKALRILGQRLAASAAPGDILARLAGDSFVLARPLATGPGAPPPRHQATAAAHALRELVNRPLDLDGLPDLRLTASLGVALYPQDDAVASSLLRKAEVALKRAKEAGRAGLAFYRPEMTQAARRRLQVENELRRALELGELRLHYQPIVAVASGALVAVEALLRWEHPLLGLIGPQEFIDVVEEGDLVHPVGRWVLAEAGAQARDWQDLPQPPRVSINISGPEIDSGTLARDLEETLKRTGLDPRRLEIEVIERVLMQDPDRALAELQRVHDLGVTIALDDFGTGYSSLSYLKRLPLDFLKIDMSFIRNLTRDPGDAAIVQSTIAMAHHFGIQVIAEGVETQEQFDYLAAAGCDLAQGYLLGPPTTAAAITAILRANPGGSAPGA